MINDLFIILYWWVLLSGYAFSKIVGLLTLAYPVWLLGSLKILPFTTGGVWLVLLANGIANYLILKKIAGKQPLRPTIEQFFKRHRRIILIEEGLFLLALLTWSIIRGFQPDIHGLEKFMDFGFINAILKSRFFPPADMWLAGKTINYYYFGHLITAVLTKISQIDSAVTYNLMVATIFALGFTAAFSLGGNLISASGKGSRKINLKLFIGTGLLTAALLTLGGNLHPLYWRLTKGTFDGYWYPDATRFITKTFGASDNTIHEFPNYSCVVADLHGHFLNFPTVLLFLALLLALASKVRSPKAVGGAWIIPPALTLGIMFITNAWDFPIYGLLLGLMVLGFSYLRSGLSLKTIRRTLKIGLPTLALAVLVLLPFQLHFENIARGISLTDFHSPGWMLLVLWGFPLFTTLSFISRKAKTTGYVPVDKADTKVRRRRVQSETECHGLCPWKSIVPRLIQRQRTRSTKVDLTDNFILILLAVAWLLILLPELIYVKDIYVSSHQRANTMFKLTYQAFVMFSISGGCILVKVFTHLKSVRGRLEFSAATLLLLSSIFAYPYFSIRSFYGLRNYRGLDGLTFLENSYPGDYAAIGWLEQNAEVTAISDESVCPPDGRLS